MKILIDIGHPAHVHYFKNLILNLEKKNYEFLIIARNKDVTHQLLDDLNFKFVNRGAGAKSIFGKAFYSFYGVFLILKNSIKFKPNIFISFASIYAGFVSFLFNKPHLTFTDTEHAMLANSILLPFSKKIVTPSCFKKDFGKKHLKFNGFFELCYLHPQYFKPKKKSINNIKLFGKEKYILLRFVSWNASHDKGYFGLSLEEKRYLVKRLKKHVKVFISSEEKLPKDLIEHQIKIKADRLHDVIAYASYVIGESGTIATESAILGVPSILFSSVPDETFGNFNELEHKYGLLKKYEKFDIGIVDEIIRNIKNEDYFKLISKNKNKLLSDKIDVNNYLIELIKSTVEKK